MNSIGSICIITAAVLSAMGLRLILITVRGRRREKEEKQNGGND